MLAAPAEVCGGLGLEMIGSDCGERPAGIIFGPGTRPTLTGLVTDLSSGCMSASCSAAVVSLYTCGIDIDVVEFAGRESAFQSSTFFETLNLVSERPVEQSCKAAG
jgi:hypothetical protein